MVDARTTQRIGASLKEHPSVYRLAAAALRTAGRVRRREQIRAYLDANARRYLRIGSGAHHDPGWLSVDLLPLDRHVVFMDVTRQLRFPSQTFDAIHCEHMIEHVSYEQGLFMLRECHRVLKPQGILRIATPNLALVPRLLESSSDTTDLLAYVEWSNETFGGAGEHDDRQNPAFAVNRLVREWGHTFIYDEHTLRSALQQAGFGGITPVRPGESGHDFLVGTDRHQEEIGCEFNALETLAFEATA